MISKPFGGPDAIRFDTRPFNISEDELERLCALFRIGRPRRWHREKGQRLSHTSFMLYMESTQGRYVMKFHLPHGRGMESAAQEAISAWRLSRLLMAKGLPVPRLHATREKQPYAISHEHITTCHDFLEGHPAYQRPLTRRKIDKINLSLSLLSQSLRTMPAITRSIRATTLPMKIRPLASAAGKDPQARQAIDRLQRTYAQYPHLFIMQPVHANLSLANIFFHQDRAYILDLGHIQTDQELAGLATLVASCLLLETPTTATRAIVSGYFARHGLKKEKMAVLGSLVQIELAKEYVKTKDRHEKLFGRKTEDGLGKEYLDQLDQRLKMLENTLAKPVY